jgi:hypothetical protein
MLARPGSTAPEDEARRQRVRQRVIDYNAALAEVCELYVRCRFDGNPSSTIGSNRGTFRPAITSIRRSRASECSRK